MSELKDGCGALLYIILFVLAIGLLASLFSRAIAPWGCDDVLCVKMCVPTDMHVCPKYDNRSKK